MAASRYVNTPEFLVRRKNDHICNEHCFPIKEITFFCFVCDDEVFRSQIGKHGFRTNRETGESETWYVCKPCYKKFKDKIDANRGPKREGWILTSAGWQMQGRFGVPSQNTLNVRRKKGYD